MTDINSSDYLTVSHSSPPRPIQSVLPPPSQQVPATTDCGDILFQFPPFFHFISPLPLSLSLSLSSFLCMSAFCYTHLLFSRFAERSVYRKNGVHQFNLPTLLNLLDLRLLAPQKPQTPCMCILMLITCTHIYGKLAKIHRSAVLQEILRRSSAGSPAGAGALKFLK